MTDIIYSGRFMVDLTSRSKFIKPRNGMQAYFGSVVYKERKASWMFQGIQGSLLVNFEMLNEIGNLLLILNQDYPKGV